MAERRHHSLGFKTAAYLLPFVIILVLFVMLEIGLRIFWEEARYQDDRPSEHIEGGIHIEINSRNWRGPEIQPKQNGEFRILAAGDSTTWGRAELFEYTWPAQLERMLQSEFPKDNIKVINTAGIGRHPHLALQNWRTSAEVEPDLVIYLICMNDIVIRTSELDQEKTQEILRKYTGWEKFRQDLSIFLFGGNSPLKLSSLRVVALGRTVIRNFFPWPAEKLISFSPYMFNVLGLGSSEAYDQAWNDTLESLELLAASLRKSGSDFAIILLPYQFLISEESYDNIHGFNLNSFRVDPSQRFRTFTAEHSIPFVDLLPDFRQARQEMIKGKRSFNRLFQPYDFIHPNAEGYRIVSEGALKIAREALTRVHQGKYLVGENS